MGVQIVSESLSEIIGIGNFIKLKNNIVGIVGGFWGIRGPENKLFIYI